MRPLCCSERDASKKRCSNRGSSPLTVREHSGQSQWQSGPQLAAVRATTLTVVSS